MTTRYPLWLALAALLAACGEDPAPSPAADMAADLAVAQDMATDLTQDLATPGEDMAPDLAQELDQAPDLADDMAADLAAPDMQDDMAPIEDMASGDMNMDALPGFGALMGDCRVLDSELTSSMPFLYENVLDFAMDPYDMSDLSRLTPGGQYMVQTPNAGGDSALSEVFAFEVLARCEDAKLLKTETEILYDNPRGKITDILVEIDGYKIGVSVVRAIQFPFNDPYPAAEADRILRKKLGDIQLSSANVTAQDRWVKQILSVIAYTPQHADQIRQVWMTLEPAVRGDTILYVTATEGDDRPIYNIP